MQNICHLSIKEDERSVGTLSLGEIDQGFVINTQTYVDNTTKELLNQFLSELSVTSPEASEEKFGSIQKDESETEIGATVLGFISLARVGKSWDYSFETHEGLPEQFFYRVYI